MKFTLVSLAVFFSFSCLCANVSIRLEIKNGLLGFNNGTSIPYKVFTSATIFQKNSDLLICQTGDVITLKVVNGDSENHAFILDGYLDFGLIIPGDSVEQTFTSLQEGVFRYYDPLNYPFNQYMGLAGIFHVKSSLDSTPYFYWDVREHQESWNSDILLGNSPVINQYDPFYFTINGNSDPDIDTDVIAKVTGNVGIEVRIVIVNNGMSIHSMHFHGFHAILVNNSKNSSHEGREKDTFPLYPKEHIVLSFIPDKPGEYPVHDHNLVAVTGGGIYHKGMFTILSIAP